MDEKNLNNDDKIPPDPKGDNKHLRSEPALITNDAELERINKEITPAPLTPKKKRTFRQKTLRFSFYSVVIFLLFLLSILILVQTSYFKNWALHFAVDKINLTLADKDSRIYIESIEGNIISGFKLHEVSVRVKNDTLLKVHSIDAAFDLFGVLNKNIYISKIQLYSPQINFAKIKDKNDSLVWNYQYILVPTVKQPADTLVKKFDWKITLDKFELIEANFRMISDRDLNVSVDKIPIVDTDTFNLSNLYLKHLDLDLSARYLEEYQIVDLKKLSFATNSFFAVKNLSFNAKVNRNKDTRITNLNFLSDRTAFTIKNVYMDKLDPLERKVVYEEFKNNNTELEIKTDKFDFKDLTYFLPKINFLSGRVYLDLKAKGTYGNINIERLIMKTDRSYYNLAGNVKGLEDPGDKLYLDITSTGSVLDGGDTKDIIPGLHVPDYSYLGPVAADFHYVGYPQKFDADVNIRSSAGNVSGKAYMDLMQREVYYKGDIRTSNLNLGRIFKDPALESNINGTFNVNAYGFDYKKLRGKIIYEVNNTQFLKQNISKSGGIVDMNGGSANVDVNYTTNYIDSKILGKIGFADIKNLSYDIKGTAGRFNIGGLTGNSSQTSNLNFTYDIKGSGTSLSNINGDIKINFQPSVYGNYKIPLTTLEGYVHKNGDSTDVDLKSPFADVRANGRYSFADLPALISSNINGIKQHIIAILKNDSLSSIPAPVNISTVYPGNASFGYDINIKDFTPIANVAGVEKVNFTAKLKGEVVNDKNIFSVKLDTGVVQKFLYGDLKDTSFYSQRVNLSGLLENKPEISGSDNFTTLLNLTSYKIDISGQPLDSVSIHLNGDKYDNKFNAYVVLDSNQKFFSTAKAVFYNDSTVMVFDSLGLKYNDYFLRDADSLVLSYVTKPGNNYFNFERFRLVENSQRINVNGIYSLNNSSDLTVSLNNIDLHKIQLRQNPEIEEEEAILGNIRRLAITYKGTTDDPEIHLEANSDILRVASNRVGRLDAIVDYKDNHIAPDISFYNENNEGRLLINGAFPFANPLRPKDSTFITEFYKNEPVKLNLDAKNFQIKVIQQLIPLTSHLAGTLEGKINFGGIVSKPEISGLMKIRDGSFVVDMTKMFYNFDVDLNTEGQKVKIDNFRLFTPVNPENRFLQGNGYVDFSNIRVSDVDVLFSGDTKLFSKENGLTSLGIEGDLTGGSGAIPLRLRGNSNGLQLTGELKLIEGNVTIDPEKKETEYVYDDDFRYVLRLDSTAYNKDTINVITNNLRDSLNAKKKKDLNPFESFFMVGKVDSTAGKKDQFFVYDINVVNDNSVFVRFITNEKSRQEFFGDVSLNLFVDNRNNGNIEARGRVNMGENSFYKFYKNFKATGYLDFNGPLVEPELNISGVYTTTRNKPNDPSNTTQEVEIDLKVTGKASNLNLGWTVYVNGDILSSSDPSADAITFIVFGKFQDELSASENLSIASSVGGVSANIGAVLVSNYFTNFIQQVIPFIVNTDINYVDSRTGSVAQNTDLRLTAQFGDAIVRVGGQIFDNISNTNVIIQYPLDKLLKLKAIQNKLILQLERTNDPLTSTNVTQSGVNETRTGAIIFYKIKF